MKIYYGERYPDPRFVRGRVSVIFTTEHPSTRNQLRAIAVPISPWKRAFAMFDWGYCGDGPALLTYSILAEDVGKPMADKYHQEFMRQVIAKLPKDEDWSMDSVDISVALGSIVHADKVAS